MAETLIEWADYTFNPWRGCTKVSAGCANCYADQQSKRNPQTLGIWGNQGTRVVAAEKYWTLPVKWNSKAAKFPGDWYCPGCLMEMGPGRVDEFGVCRECGEDCRYVANRPRVFCASLADVFEDWPGSLVMPNGQIACDGEHAGAPGRYVGQNTPVFKDTLFLQDVRCRLFELIDATPWLDWLIVTKRPENIRRMWPAKRDMRPVFPGAPGKLGEPLPCLVEGAFRPNVWLLTSVENQEQADTRIPELLKCRDLSPVLGLSCEPLLGPLDLRRWMYSQELLTCQKCGEEFASGESDYNGLSPCCMREGDPNGSVVYSDLDWIIAGGESGPNARPMHPDWARSLRDQCRAAEVPFFFKQWGEWEPRRLAVQTDLLDARKEVIVRRGGGISSGLAPYSDSDYVMDRVGKKQAGRRLEGREWSEFPQPVRTFA